MFTVWISLDLNLLLDMVIFRLGPGTLSSLTVLVFLFPLVAAGVVNRTIDDSFGDSQTGLRVIYQPANAGIWKDQSCIGCAINADTSQTFKGTYTAATYAPSLNEISITMKFNGTAVYVFFVLANNEGDGITTLTVANFTLDGNAPQNFQHAPDLTSQDLQYNQLVFSQTNLINAEHTLLVSTSGVNSNVYVNFDYTIYTHDDDAPLLPLPSSGSSSSLTSGSTSSATSKSKSSTSSPPSSPTSSIANNADPQSLDKKSAPAGAIAGGVVGGLAILAFLVALALCHIRRRRKRLKDGRSAANGYTPPLMAEFGPPTRSNNPTDFAIVPFTDPYKSQSTKQLNLIRGLASTAALTQTSSSSFNNQAPSSVSHSDTPYDGYLSPEPSGVQKEQNGNHTTPINSGVAHPANSTQMLLRSVTEPDHLSSPGGVNGINGPTFPSSMHTSDDIEYIRRARQNELDQRLRTVQEEIVFLASDISGEKGGRHRSVTRRRTVVGQGEADIVEVEEEMSMAEMKEQLRFLKEQIEYLREQQRSAWAQGLSDDPPPDYTPAMSA